jgi:SAM-dependent methyltransferase
MADDAGDRERATALRAMLGGFRLAQAVAVAAELRVADRLAGGPVPSEDLARAVGADADALYRLLRALAAEGIFTESPPGTFGLTPLAEPLRADHPQSVRPQARLVAQEFWWGAWGHLLEAVRTGGVAFERIHGAPLFAYLDAHPDAAGIFDGAMSGTSPWKAALAAAYDFAPVRLVVDVGGGQGALLAAVLRAHPHLRGVLFDTPAVVAGARRFLDAAGLADRCRIVGGDFFASVPEGGDAYLLSQVLHDWDDERAAAILRSCHRAARPGARLIVVEQLLPPGDTPHRGKLLDLQLLVMLGGRERTEAEYRRLFTAAGFESTSARPLGPELSVLEGIRR